MTNKMTRMKPSEVEELVNVYGKGRMLCRDLFGGHIKRETFVRTMIDYPYTDPALADSYVPTGLFPQLPGTRESILDWALGIGYIEQDVYDEITEKLDAKS